MTDSVTRLAEKINNLEPARDWASDSKREQEIESLLREAMEARLVICDDEGCQQNPCGCHCHEKLKTLTHQRLQKTNAYWTDKLRRKVNQAYTRAAEVARHVPITTWKELTNVREAIAAAIEALATP